MILSNSSWNQLSIICSSFLFKITSFIHILIEMSYWKSCQYSRWEPRVVKYMLGSYVYIQPSMPHDLVCLITSKKLDWGLVEIFPQKSAEGRAQGCSCFARVHGMELMEGEKSRDFWRSFGAGYAYFRFHQGDWLATSGLESTRGTLVSRHLLREKKWLGANGATVSILVINPSTCMSFSLVLMKFGTLWFYPISLNVKRIRLPPNSYCKYPQKKFLL